MAKYKNKYRIESARLQNWDYGWAAAYFITICTKNRVFYFGDICDGRMQLSPVGAIANVLWHEIKNHTKNVELGEFVVMPNHIHGILILNGNTTTKTIADDGGNGDRDGNGNGNGNGNDNGNGNENENENVKTRHALSLQPQREQPQREPPKTIGQKRFQNQGKNTVSSIIGGYKSAVTKYARRMGFEFGWQPRFYDHIIRNEKSFTNITNYIINNPLNWKQDKFFQE